MSKAHRDPDHPAESKGEPGIRRHYTLSIAGQTKRPVRHLAGGHGQEFPRACGAGDTGPATPAPVRKNVPGEDGAARTFFDRRRKACPGEVIPWGVRRGL